MNNCAKTNLVEELLVSAMKNLKADTDQQKMEDELFKEQIKTSKLQYEDILNIHALEEEIRESCGLLDQEGKDEDEYSKETHFDKPIFDGANISFGTSILLMMAFVLRYSLSGVAIADLLMLISFHCTVPNLCKTSLKAFKCLFHDLSAPITLHKYCAYCFTLIEDKSSASCPNTFCNEDITRTHSVSYFLTMSIEKQLEKLFRKPDFIKDIKHKLNRKF